MKLKNPPTGFTLMEILIYVAVLAIIIVAISSFFLWATRSNIKAKVMRETLDNARRTMEIVTHEIKEAKSILPSTPIHLSLEREDGTNLDFYLCGTAFCLKKGLEDAVTLTSDRVEVSNLNFTQITTDTSTSSVQIGLEVNYKNPGNRSEYQALVNVTSTASLRLY